MREPFLQPSKAYKEILGYSQSREGRLRVSVLLGSRAYFAPLDTSVGRDGNQWHRHAVLGERRGDKLHDASVSAAREDP